MLAAAGDYLSLWQLPVVLGLAAVWVLLGGYLLRRSVRERVPRGKGSLGRCLLIAFLMGLGGGLAGITLMFLVQAVGEQLGVRTILAAVAAVAVGFVAVSFCVLWASFDLRAGAAAGVGLAAFGPPLLIGALVATPLGWQSYHTYQREIRRRHSEVHLRAIYQAIRLHYHRGLPPNDLRDLVRSDIIPAGYLKARANTGRDVDYFYVPAPLASPGEECDRVLACDFLDNHGGTGRAVLFANGVARWHDGQELRALFQRDENRGFAIALQQAEKDLRKD